MLKDITLGQYFPGSTVAHRLDPRTKILLVVLYIVALFTAKGAAGYLVMAATLAVCVRISRVPLRSLVRGLKPVLFIIIFTAVLNLFFTPAEEYLFQWGFLRVSESGLRNAFFMVVRIMLLIMGTFLMTYTTSPISLTDGLERLLNWMKRLHVPVHELAMMMSIALRFIPTLIEETDKIMSAQKARGADFESGNLIQKAKAMLPPGGRAGHGHGVPLLPRRRGPHEAPCAPVPAAGLYCPDPGRRDFGGGDPAAAAGDLNRAGDGSSVRLCGAGGSARPAGITPDGGRWRTLPWTSGSSSRRAGC